MAYVYRYIDNSDGIIKYVGIVWGKNTTLTNRIYQHKYNDDWCKGKDFTIEYIKEDINTRTDAEYFEAHYISLYQTDKYFNIAKSGWGVSSFLPNRENDWVVYNGNEFVKQNDHIFKVYIKDNKELCVERIPVIKKICKTKCLPEYLRYSDYHCKCGSNELYNRISNGHGELYCKECGSWVMHCSSNEKLLYTPEYNGEYVMDNGKIATHEYYVICSGKKHKWKGYKKEELESIFSTFAYALAEDNIEETKLKLLRYLNKAHQSNLSSIETKIAELKKELNKLQNDYNQFTFNFNSYLSK